MMRFWFVATPTAMAAASLTTAAVGQYRRAPLIGGGYSDKRVSENRWKVSGFAVEQPHEYAIKLALYRAAILLKRAGFSHLQIVNSNISGSVSIYARNELADFTVVGTNTPDVAIPCEAKPKWAANCRLLNVDETLATAAPALGRDEKEDLAPDPTGR